MKEPTTKEVIRILKYLRAIWKPETELAYLLKMYVGLEELEEEIKKLNCETKKPNKSVTKKRSGRWRRGYASRGDEVQR